MSRLQGDPPDNSELEVQRKGAVYLAEWRSRAMGRLRYQRGNCAVSGRELGLRSRLGRLLYVRGGR